jgi:sugar lactone lactonase YvrE
MLDMVVDAQGRAYVGNFGFDLHAREKVRTMALALVLPSGEARIAARDLTFPNGCVITPDGRTLIIAETMALRLTAFDIAADGSLVNRRVFAQLEKRVLDGICLDAEGAVWVASSISAECVRVHEGGRISATVKVATQAYACMLGGPDRKTLFICTAADSDPVKCVAARSGRIGTVRVDVAGAGLP